MADISTLKEMHNPRQNHLLAALPKSDYNLLLPRLELVELPLGKILYESSHTFTNVYFPTTAIVSLLYVLENGASAEIAVVGNEGIVGIACSWAVRACRTGLSCRVAATRIGSMAKSSTSIQPFAAVQHL